MSSQTQTPCCRYKSKFSVVVCKADTKIYSHHPKKQLEKSFVCANHFTVHCFRIKGQPHKKAGCTLNSNSHVDRCQARNLYVLSFSICCSTLKQCRKYLLFREYQEKLCEHLSSPEVDLITRVEGLMLYILSSLWALQNLILHRKLWLLHTWKKSAMVHWLTYPWGFLQINAVQMH